MSEEADRDLSCSLTTHHPSPITHRCLDIVSLVSACAALVIAFFGLLQFDLPIVRYLRTFTTHQAGEALTVPWMAFFSDAGDWIGYGWRLTAVSVLLLAIGWSCARPNFKLAGIDTLLAHGLAAVLSNGLKHLLGRPRPKFVHSGEWQFTPSFASGLDSFPSGHTTASFAIAAALAKRFPAFAPLCFGIAAFVGISRVIRGSHFPTDVLGGAVLGIVSGSVAAAPLRAWRESIQQGLRHAALGGTAVLALIWTFARPADGEITGTLLFGLGTAATAVGLWLRRTQWTGNEQPMTELQNRASLVLIAYGLACMTTAPLVLAAVGFACLAFWFQGNSGVREVKRWSEVRRLMMEGALVMFLLMALTILFAGRGVLPFR
ncbi:MAG: phosphatase PAP2 family protein [Nitrospirae bacterium]|nr:phosphatase PAP2 family protein [Nitrospirota bacterium]